MRRLRWLAGALVVPAAATAAWAAWTADVAPGGHGAAAATEVGAGARPTATADRDMVTVTWAPAELTDGTPVTDYVVTRTDATSGAPATTGSSCSGIVTAATCTEPVPDGTWRYTVTPAVGTHWRGPASPESAPVVVDTTGPAGGSVVVQGLTGTGGRYSTTGQLSLALSPGTDPHGLAPGARLLRSEATLASTGGSTGTCGSFDSTAVPILEDPGARVSDLVPEGERCYRYQYVVTDAFGNATTYTSPAVAVDTTPPSAPTFTSLAGANAFVSGSTTYYRPGVSGSFTVTAASRDTGSGVAAYSFPAAGSGAPTVNGRTATYTWTATTPPFPASNPVTARNHAGTTSPPAGFTVVADSTPPAGGSVSYTDGLTTASRLTVGLDRGSDTQSGIAQRELKRAAAPLTDGTCGPFGPFGRVVNGLNPVEPRLDPVEPGFCYQYRYEVTDRVGNVGVYESAAIAKVPYSGYARNVRATEGLSRYWRLGEPTMVYDSFAGAAGAGLVHRSPEVGAAWTKHALTPDNVRITAEGRVRRVDESMPYLGGVYFSSIPQDRTDYTVEADLYYASALTNDAVALTARLDGDEAFSYAAGYDQATQTWQLLRITQTKTAINKDVLVESAVDLLTPGETYHVALDMQGTRMRLLVDGVERLTADDAALTIGTGGILLGFGGEADTAGGGRSPAPTETTGMHLDNFRITPSMRDTSAAQADGFYLGAPALDAVGAPVDDQNSAARFDGVNDEARATADLAEELSVELFFSATEGAGGGATWRDAAGLLSTEELGIGLTQDGSVVAGAGDATVRTGPGLADGSWHHVVLTRSGGVLRLYLDGTEVADGAAPLPTPVAATAVVLGRSTGGAFAGLLDEVAIYTGALAPETVAAHHFAATTPGS